MFSILLVLSLPYWRRKDAVYFLRKQKRPSAVGQPFFLQFEFLGPFYSLGYSSLKSLYISSSMQSGFSVLPLPSASIKFTSRCSSLAKGLTPFSPCSFWGFISSGMKGVRKAFRSLYSTVNDLCSTIESRSRATCTSLLSLVYSTW